MRFARVTEAAIQIPTWLGWVSLAIILLVVVLPVLLWMGFMFNHHLRAIEQAEHRQDGSDTDSRGEGPIAPDQ